MGWKPWPGPFQPQGLGIGGWASASALWGGLREARDLGSNESREGSLASPPQRYVCSRPAPLCRCQALGTAITHPKTLDIFSFIYYYVLSFLCKRQPYVNFIPFSNGLGYITNNSKMENLYWYFTEGLLTSRHGDLNAVLRVYGSWEAELPHMTLNVSLCVYHGLIVELHFSPFSSSLCAVPPVRDGYNSIRKQRSVWDNFLSCPEIAGCLLVSGVSWDASRPPLWLAKLQMWFWS